MAIFEGGAARPVYLIDSNGNPLIGPTGLIPVAFTPPTGASATQVQGPGAAGAAPVGTPVFIAGWDATNLRPILVDASGRLVMVGAAADGAAVAGNPVLTGGFDGTNAQSFLTSPAGRQQIAASAALAAGATLPGGAAAVTDSSDVSRGLAVALFGYNGTTNEPLRTPNIFKPIASTAVTAGTGITIWDPAASRRFRLMGYVFSCSSAAQLLFCDNAVGTVIARSETLAANGVAKLEDIGNGIPSAAVNNNLLLDVTVNGNVAGMVWGTEET